MPIHIRPYISRPYISPSHRHDSSSDDDDEEDYIDEEETEEEIEEDTSEDVTTEDVTTEVQPLPTEERFQKDDNGSYVQSAPRYEKKQQEPKIYNSLDTNIPVGKKFKATDYIIASDDQDGSLTDRVHVKGTVDTSKEGTYPVVYTVKDTDGHGARLKLIFKVQSHADIDDEDNTTEIVTSEPIKSFRYEKAEDKTSVKKEQHTEQDDDPEWSSQDIILGAGGTLLILTTIGLQLLKRHFRDPREKR